VTNTRQERGTPDIDLSRAIWRKSTASGGNGSCVEVADLGTIVAVRDSKDQSGPVLVISSESWQVLTSRIKTGEFGL
jgi:hypothetical protein